MFSKIKNFPSEFNKAIENSNVLILVAIFAAINLVGYFLYGFVKSGVGFPLDDAWIHQTYARNLVNLHSWSFLPGQVSGGSTSPLWTILISFGYLISAKFGVIWTFIISAFSFVLLVIISVKSFEKLTHASKKAQLLLGFLLATEWHLLWSTTSGMETVLFCLGTVLTFFLLTQRPKGWWKVGLISGLLVWVRPDGLTLLGPVVLVLAFSCLKTRPAWKNVVCYFVPLIIGIGAYVGFNLTTTGNIFPNTFYAKQMEYQELLLFPVWQRILNEFEPLMTGIGILLLPGFIYGIWNSIQKKDVLAMAFSLWVIGFVCLYALRLPVVYQYGRYVMPVIPLFVILGMIGSRLLLQKLINKKQFMIIKNSWLGAILIIALAFYFIGMKNYAEDLKLINKLMVEPAKWVEQNTASHDIIAVHDIGAMGYFSNRRLIDLAGLINPEVVPFIRDESKLYQYMKFSDADYYVGFSDWYSETKLWGSPVKIFYLNYNQQNKEIDILKLR